LCIFVGGIQTAFRHVTINAQREESQRQDFGKSSGTVPIALAFSQEVE
jgi:hypothetical protein